MSATDVLIYLWLASAILSGTILPIWGITELRSGRARFTYPGEVVQRQTDAHDYWMLVTFKLLALPVATAMLWFGLKLLRS